MQIFVFLAFLIFSTFSALGVVLLEEPFSYINGSLVTVSSNKWQNHSGTNGFVTVVSGRAFITHSGAEDVNSLLGGQPYSSSSPVSLFARFTIHFTALPSSTGGYFAHFKNSGTSDFRGKLFATTDNAATGRFRIGIAKVANSPDAIAPMDLELNTDYVIVLKYVVSSGATTLWVNPGSEGSPSVTATDPVTASTVISFALRQSSGMGSLYVNDLRIGTDPGDVFSGIPATISSQPQSQSVTEGANVTMSAGISGSVPLSVQWFFNGNAVAGETNSVLNIESAVEANEGAYFVAVSNAFGNATSDSALLTVNQFEAYQPAALSLLSYNVKGNNVTDWSTNSLQVQAIGRQLVFLQPDIITFQEIPRTNTFEMTNWVRAFFPGYFLAMNSGTDGFIRSVIASRFPITRSESWLDGADLRPFGFTSTNQALDNFSRDLFEAEIAVPHFAQPFHVFTTHLKSGGVSEDVAKRAAEASAISNYFVAGFLTTNATRPYVLTGDMNESNTNQLSIQRLISAPTGLRLTNPQNPFTGSSNTWSSASSNPASRLDYIMPGGLMFSNINNSQVFRTDRLTPVPPGLLADDCKVASDHLPVLMVFNNPYDGSFRTTSLLVTNEAIIMSWESSRGRRYEVESSSNFTQWNVLISDLVAKSTNMTFSTNVIGSPRFFRVNRLP